MMCVWGLGLICAENSAETPHAHHDTIIKHRNIKDLTSRRGKLFFFVFFPGCIHSNGYTFGTSQGYTFGVMMGTRIN